MTSFCRNRSKGKSPCRSRSSKAPGSSIKKLVEEYMSEVRPLAQEELRFFKEQPDITSALHAAAMSEYPPGKRHDHQRRISHTLLELCSKRLRGLDYTLFNDFDALHSKIEETIGTIRGIGPLTVYDISHRVGCYLGFDPQRVYLHAGTRKGAGMLGLGHGKPWLEMSELPKEVRRLKPCEAEDFLCIYKPCF